MRIPYAASALALLRPRAAFPAPAPPLGRAVGAMLLAWAPLALANALGTLWNGLRAYEAFRRTGPPAWLAARLELDPTDLAELLRGLPPAPGLHQVWPWLLLLVPLGILGTWIHDAVWDHTGLWILGGLKAGRGFRTSLVAEAEALRIAALGTLLGLLGFVPVLGWILALPLMALEAYLWLFRGFALAARHGCEPWKGIAATVLHAVLFGAFALLLGLLAVAALRMGP